VLIVLLVVIFLIIALQKKGIEMKEMPKKEKSKRQARLTDGVCCDWSDSSGPPLDIIVLDSGSIRSMKEFEYSTSMLMLYFYTAATYDKYLDLNPGLEGTIVIKFIITHDGKVINDTILSSTTGNKKFDEKVKNNLHHCKWQEISIWKRITGKNVTTTVTLPITFWKSRKDFRMSKPALRAVDSIVKYHNQKFNKEDTNHE
jgi:TonB family protein